jgi:NAD(P)-dependent dehydrogenase (short-subunit alcohol dehydrogenase family)
MSDPLAGKSVVVIGSSSGIGRTLALALLGRGMRVVAAARSVERLQELERDSAGAVLPVAVDVRSEDSVNALAAAAARLCGGKVDVVINSAGVGYLEPFLESDMARWRDTLETNLIGALLVLRAFLPGMLQVGKGVMVNVGSTGASGWPYLTLYSASKAALQAASASIGHEHRGRGVRVVVVDVGSTSGTDFGARFDPASIGVATRAWTECGIPWDREMATPAESAARVVGAVEGALSEVEKESA